MMNPAVTAALLAASSHKSVETIEGKLRAAGATSQARAVVLELEGEELGLVEEAIAGGKVRRTSEGRLFLDDRKLAQGTDGQVFTALLILLVTASIIASVAAIVVSSAG